MKVLKFGGTSVGTIESLTNVKKIVEGLSEPANLHVKPILYLLMNVLTLSNAIMM